MPGQNYIKRIIGVAGDRVAEHLDAAGGTVAEDRLVGRAFVTFRPLTRARSLAVPATFADVPAPR